MDIVYLVKNCQTNEELVYSLRSLVNIPHDKVFVVGGCPSELDASKIIHIPIVQSGNKYKNTTNSLRYICQDSRVSDDFVLMNDDFFILEPITDPVKELNLCRGTIREVLDEMRKRHNFDGQYMIGMNQMDIYLKDLGYKEPLSYELHIPFIINKNKFLRLFSLPNLESIKVLHKRSLYGNMYLKDSKKIKDVKIYRDFFVPIGSDKFLSTEDISFPRVKNYLKKLFPNKSDFEL